MSSDLTIIEHLNRRLQRLGVGESSWLWGEVCRRLNNREDLKPLFDAIERAELLAAVSPNPCRQEPEPDKVSGDIELGTTFERHVVYCLDSSKPPLHILVTGATQHGKSTFIRVFFRNGHKVVVVWIDDVKGDHEHLVKDFPDIKVIRPTSSITQFKLNPFEPPGATHPHQWISEITEITCNTHDLLEASSSLIEQALFELYRQLGVFDGSRNYPTLHDLIKYIEGMQLSYRENYRTIGARDSVLARLRSLRDYLGDCFNCASGHPIEQLAEHHIVWAFSDMTKSHRAFFSAVKNFKLLHYRRSAHDRGHGIRNVLVIEEAKDQFHVSRDKNTASGLSKSSLFVTLCAEFRIMLLAVDQDTGTAISQILKDNTGIKILLGAYGGDNLRGVAADMGLNPDQKEFNYVLKPGMFMVRDKRFPVVFLCRFPDYPIVKDVPPEVSEAACAAWLRTVPWEKPRLAQAQPQVPDKLPELTQGFLRHVYDKPFMTATQRQGHFCEQHRVEKDDYYALRAAALRSKLVHQVGINPTGEKGRNILLMELTQAGCKLIDVPVSKPSVLHRYLQRFIAKLAEQRGMTTQYEKVIHGVRVDVLLSMPGRHCAVEVALDKTYEISKVPMLLNHIGLVCLVCRDAKVEKQLRMMLDQAIAPELKPRVKVSVPAAAYRDADHFFPVREGGIDDC